ncbi:Detected protein of confused Function [Hibiscus syriacus]|uniref:Detected protein of confused Function n=2 Tax=Hibiscus syriacus TaxID=106335 RepID=A0A6A3CVN1_HIBSY|nr:Detected protein of confused Function [Hibiscus syriacus]
MRISCGARENVRTPPTYANWYKDFGYTGGIPDNATSPSFITPPLKTLRYFPRSEGPENCYGINRVPKGHYTVRIFFGLIAQPDFDNEPLFDVSVEGTLIHSLKSGWTSNDEQSFVEALVFLLDGTLSICFHSTGHGDPAIISIEILQVDDKAYNFGPEWGKGVILKTTSRLTCGTSKPRFDEDYSGDHWGGDRYWHPIRTFGQNADEPRSTENAIKQASDAPNFYPEALYQSAVVSTDSQPDLAYTMDVDPNKNYSIWLHFAEIDSSIRGAGERVFDVMINGDTVFENIDVVKRSGDRYTALVLNRTTAVSGRTLTITLHPKSGNHAILNAIEVFQVIAAESKTSLDEVRALHALKKALGLPTRFGWNGDPCVPKEHPWSGADCHFDKSGSNWFIDGLDLDNQGLKGFLPDEISKLHRLQSLNLSGNTIHGAIPSSLGTVTTLQFLDLSYNSLNGSIPEGLGQLTALRRLNLNGNSLSGRVPAALGGRLLNGASFNFTDNAGLCGIPGLRTCGPHLSAGAKVGIAFSASLAFLLLVICSVCYWKRRQNILRAQQMAARGAPYAKARTQFSRDIQMSRHHNHHHNHGNTRTAAENGPSLLS